MVLEKFRSTVLIDWHAHCSTMFFSKCVLNLSSDNCASRMRHSNGHIYNIYWSFWPILFNLNSQSGFDLFLKITLNFNSNLKPSKIYRKFCYTILFPYSLRQSIVDTQSENLKISVFCFCEPPVSFCYEAFFNYSVTGGVQCQSAKSTHLYHNFENKQTNK